MIESMAVLDCWVFMNYMFLTNEKIVRCRLSVLQRNTQLYVTRFVSPVFVFVFVYTVFMHVDGVLHMSMDYIYMMAMR